MAPADSRNLTPNQLYNREEERKRLKRVEQARGKHQEAIHRLIGLFGFEGAKKVEALLRDKAADPDGDGLPY